MDARRISATAASLALASLALWAPSAPATFHLISVREVYPGSAASPNAEYVELQMYSSGQHEVAGHVIRTYDATGALMKANKFPSDVTNIANQSTLLLATPEAEAEFGIAPDGALAPSGQLDPAGGAVCWESFDCVSWGSFAGSLPSPAGTPAGAIPDGMALRRTIAPGCATLLEEADDRDNSNADFPAAFPNPRPNSVAPSEHACSSGGLTGPGNEQGAPQTTLKRKPPKRGHDRTPTFRFGSDQGGSTFECKLDGRKFKACRAPFTSRRLGLGRHTFRVRARNDSGELDPSPAVYSFKVTAKR